MCTCFSRRNYFYFGLKIGPLLMLKFGGLWQADEAYVLPVLLRFEGHPEVDQQVINNILMNDLDIR